MGSGTPESKKGDRIRRERLDEARRRAVAESQKRHEHARGAPVPESGVRSSDVLHATAIAEEALGMGGELAGSFGAAMLGIAVGALAQGAHIVGAIGETADANRRAATALGIRHAVSAMSTEITHADSPLIKDGKPLTATELNRKAEIFARERDRELTFLGVENSNARQQYDRGMSSYREGLNNSIRGCKTADERKVAVHAYNKSVADEIAKRSRAWQQEAQRRTQSHR